MAYKTNPDAQEALAAARFIRMSPTKARQVVDLIRGRHVDDARRVLKFTPRAAAPVVGKVLESAIANAEHNRGLPGDELVVTRAWVDEGPTLRRYRPRAQGRGEENHQHDIPSRLDEPPQERAVSLFRLTRRGIRVIRWREHPQLRRFAAALIAALIGHG